MFNRFDINKNNLTRIWHCKFNKCAFKVRNFHHLQHESLTSNKYQLYLPNQIWVRNIYSFFFIFFILLYIYSMKILLLTPKFEIMMSSSKHLFCQYCYSNIGLFSIALCKVMALNLLCFIYGIISFLLFLIALSQQELKSATTIAIAIVGIVISIQRAIQKRSHEPISKTNTKMKQRG